jgi:hypothetical protein
MAKTRSISIDRIVKKLIKAGLIKEDPDGFIGKFSINRDSHLLTAIELEKFIFVLHLAMPEHNQECIDMHHFKFRLIED